MRASRPLVCAALCAALMAASAGCSRGGRVIPRSDMVDIYADLLMADQWLSDQRGAMTRMSDTTMYYEPIFNKYGYTTEDFRRSVNRYLDDPARYSKMLKKVEAKLDAGAKALEAQIEGEGKARAEYAHWKSIYERLDLYYPSLLADTARLGVSETLDSMLRTVTEPVRYEPLFPADEPEGLQADSRTGLDGGEAVLAGAAAGIAEDAPAGEAVEAPGSVAAAPVEPVLMKTDTLPKELRLPKGRRPLPGTAVKEIKR